MATSTQMGGAGGGEYGGMNRMDSGLNPVQNQVRTTERVNWRLIITSTGAISHPSMQVREWHPHSRSHVSVEEWRVCRKECQVRVQWSKTDVMHVTM